MKRRDLLRAGVLTGAAAALRPPITASQNPAAAAQPNELTPAQRGVDASKDLASPNWKLLFFDEHQNETLIILSDLIIPATDTPGAKAALVNRYIDLVLAAETRENQRAFLNSLSYLDGESMRRYKSAFRYLPGLRPERSAACSSLSRCWSRWTSEAAAPNPGHTHFELLKQRIGIAYYNSEIGTNARTRLGRQLHARDLSRLRPRREPQIMFWNVLDQDPLKQTYDVIVVGSGATGGWAAKQCAEAGLKVALLEAGRAVSPTEFTEHMPAFKLKYRDHSPEVVRTRPVQKQCYACMEYNYEWFVNDLENPYSTPADKPFTWQRLRVLGGRSLVWGRQSYRMSDNDFKAASRDGYGDDWPISYADLAPFYDIVEKYVGITGAAEGNEMLPDGQFLPPMKMSCGEILLRERVKAKFGRTVTIGRAAVLTQPHNGRSACHYCGPCERGCRTFSYFSSPFTTVADAQNSGNCNVITTP